MRTSLLFIVIALSWGCGEAVPDNKDVTTETVVQAVAAPITVVKNHLARLPTDEFVYDWSAALASTKKNCPNKVGRDADGAEALTFWSVKNARQVVWNAKTKKARYLRRVNLTTTTIFEDAPRVTTKVRGQKYLNANERAALATAIKAEMKGKINVCA